LSEEAVSIAEANGWGTHRIVAPAAAAEAAALAWLGRIDEAERWLIRVERREAPAEELEVEPVLHFAHAFVRLGQGRYEEALAEFRAAEATQRLLAREHALTVEVRAWILHTQVLMGATAPVRAALAGFDPEVREGAGMRLAAAGLALAEGRPQDAVDVLAPVLADRERVVDGRPEVLNLRRATVHALLFDAVARDQLGDPSGTELSIERALELAEMDGTILQFVLVPVRELLVRHPRHRTAHATLLTTILDLLGGTPPEGRREMPQLRDELSEAEVRVARYLPSNLKAPEIASELFVSANTVRTHLRHIYAKLDAHSRGEAVERARELGLLAPSGRPR
jgi:LuxR family maltose regulon positive regulatory protein